MNEFAGPWASIQAGIADTHRFEGFVEGFMASSETFNGEFHLWSETGKPMSRVELLDRLRERWEQRR